MPARLRSLVFDPVDIASLAIYRILFGILMVWGLGRFWWNGWLERSFLEPTFFFKYWGLEWISVPGPWGVYLLFTLGILGGFGVLFGLFYRVSALVTFVSFSWIEFMDQSNYLNHYYLVSLLAFLNLFLPLNRKWSLDVFFGLTEERDLVPAWCLNLLRFQVATVYFFAGLAKLGSDWLLHAQPLNLWMTGLMDLPVIGGLLTQSWMHYAMAWAGFLFDTFIWIFMLIPFTRIPAYLVILVFHFFTGVFFPIGLFPWIMASLATLFFSPAWPRKIKERFFQTNPVFYKSSYTPERRKWILVPLGVYLSLQVLIPLRHFAYSSDLLWSEEGMRFSWKVMVREKNGQLTYRVVDRNSGKTWFVSPSQYLAQHQELEMSGQADMILQLAHHIRNDFSSRGVDVAIFADSWISLNGRPAARFLDPNRDLTQIRETWAQKDWILPAPTVPPLPLQARSL